MRRSVQKRSWLASMRGLGARFAAATFPGKPARVWQAVAQKVSGGWMFSVPVAEEQKAKRVRKKKEA